MSNLRPNKYGGQQTRSKTTNTELRVADANAGLTWHSNDLRVVGNVVPGSLSFQASASQVEVKHGTNAVTHERHMSERSSGFQANVGDTTKLLGALQNMTSVMPYFVQATQGFTQSTIMAGSTSLQLTLADATGLTTNDLVWAEQGTGLAVQEEERYIKNVQGNNVTLQRPFSFTPNDGTQLKRAVDVVKPEAGSDYKEWTANMKMTGDDSSVHILHYESTVVGQGTKDPGSNSAVMGSQLQFSSNALEYDHEGESVPKFSEEHMLPPNVAKGINL